MCSLRNVYSVNPTGFSYGLNITIYIYIHVPSVVVIFIPIFDQQYY